MKRTLLAAIVVALSSAAIAQVPPADPKPATPATNNPDVTRPAAPAKGANSFTEAQAKSRIEMQGFTNVSGLKKDKDGIWRGTAMKAGASHEVALDYQGHVFPN